jgi:hypothetical protein
MSAFGGKADIGPTRNVGHMGWRNNSGLQKNEKSRNPAAVVPKAITN